MVDLWRGIEEVVTNEIRVLFQLFETVPDRVPRMNRQQVLDLGRPPMFGDERVDVSGLMVFVVEVRRFDKIGNERESIGPRFRFRSRPESHSLPQS